MTKKIFGRGAAIGLQAMGLAVAMLAANVTLATGGTSSGQDCNSCDCSATATTCSFPSNPSKCTGCNCTKGGGQYICSTGGATTPDDPR